MGEPCAALAFHPEQLCIALITDKGQVLVHNLRTRKTDPLATAPAGCMRLFFLSGLNGFSILLLTCTGALFGFFPDGLRVIKSLEGENKPFFLNWNKGMVADAATLTEDGWPFLLAIKLEGKTLRTWCIPLEVQKGVRLMDLPDFRMNCLLPKKSPTISMPLQTASSKTANPTLDF